VWTGTSPFFVVEVSLEIPEWPLSLSRIIRI
jgi:hypothetical protein